MKKILILAIVILPLIILADHLYMDSPINTGANAVYYNPSFLARKDVPMTSFDFWRINLGFSNNLISPAYTAYLFPHGMSITDLGQNLTLAHDTIDDSKKQSILNTIGDYYLLDLGLQAASLPLNFKIHNFAFSMKTYLGNLVHIPQDYFTLSLYGNEFGNIYDFSELYISSAMYNAMTLGFGFQLPLSDERLCLNFGLSGSYILGIYYMDLDVDSMYFESDSNYLRNISFVSLDYAVPYIIELDDFDSIGNPFEDGLSVDYFRNNIPFGHGYDINVGLSVQLDDEYMIETSLDHAFSRVYWRQWGKSYEMRLVTDSLNVLGIYNLMQIVNDTTGGSEDTLASLLLDYEINEIQPTLTTHLEPVFNLGFLYKPFIHPFNVFMRYTQGFRNTAFSSKTPKFTLGVQYTLWNWALVEAAVAGGGREMFQFNIGLGTNTDRMTSDLNLSQDRGLFNYQKGLHLSMNSNTHSNIKGRFKGYVVDSTTNMPLVANVTMRYLHPAIIDTMTTTEDGIFEILSRKTDILLVVTADRYDTIYDSIRIRDNRTSEKTYRLNPSMGRLIVNVIDGITKKVLPEAQVIFTDGDTLFTDAQGNVEKQLDEGEHAVVVRYDKREDVVFTVEVERGKDYSELVELYPLYGQMEFRTYNASTSEPVDAKVYIYTLDMKAIIDSIITGEDGVERSSLIRKGNYNIHVEPLVKKYIKQDKFNIEVKGGYLKKVDIGLLKEKMVFVFNNILFDYNKATLRPESYPVCDSLASIMKENPSIKVEISGHTDTRGSNSYNKKLSQSRAESVRNYLIKEHNISANRIIAVGYGEERPMVFPETGEADYQKNRRVEFTVLGGN